MAVDEEINFSKNEKATIIALGIKNQSLLACYFQWFVLSVTNYLRIVGLIDIFNSQGWCIEKLHDKSIKRTIKKHCDKYVKEVVPDLLIWRNKVGAHYAATYPYEDDNIGTLAFSLINPVTYNKPYFEVGRLIYTLGNNKVNFPIWRLTETYENLSTRFWPNHSLAEIE